MSEQAIHAKTNLTMLTDFYELTMANGYFNNGFENTIAYFDMFFRKVPDGGGFAYADAGGKMKKRACLLGVGAVFVIFAVPMKQRIWR